MNAREEKRAAFNEQMGAWVSRQGIWFQLRHAVEGQSLWIRLVRVFIRFFVLFVILAFLVWLYLVKRIETEGFRLSVQNALQEKLAGDACEVGAIQKSRKTITIDSIESGGTEGSFFHQLSARKIRLNMGITDGLLGEWDMGIVGIDYLDMELKAGERDDVRAAESYGALFVEGESFNFERIAIDQINVGWGYSAANRGSISGSSMTLAKQGDSLRMEFRGGTFSQNWVKNMEIERLLVLCDREGVSIEEAVLRSGEGLLTFSLRIGLGAQPEISGTVQIDSMPLKAILPPRYEEWLHGSISGRGEIGGSTNSQDGVVLDVGFFMGERDVMVLRDRLPLLSALSVVDLYNSYRKVSFNEGGFRVKTSGGKVSISDLNIRAGNLLYLKGGSFVLRPPTKAEVAEALGIDEVEIVARILENRWKFDEYHNFVEAVDLKKGLVSGKSEGENSERSDDKRANSQFQTVDDVFTLSILNESKIQRFDGELRMGLKGDAFDKAEKLKTKYPVDELSGRIWMHVPLRGRLQSLTLDQAREFYVLGKNRL